LAGVSAEPVRFLPICGNNTTQSRISFVDRDMVMRYYWGLGIGHIYSHHQDSVWEKPSQHDSSSTDDSCSAHKYSSDDENSFKEKDSADDESLKSDENAHDLQGDQCDDSDSSDSGEGFACNPSDEESLLAFDAMYGDDWENEVGVPPLSCGQKSLQFGHHLIYGSFSRISQCDSSGDTTHQCETVRAKSHPCARTLRRAHCG
jgi:hypothetical protein